MYVMFLTHYGGGKGGGGFQSREAVPQVVAGGCRGFAGDGEGRRGRHYRQRKAITWSLRYVR